MNDKEAIEKLRELSKQTGIDISGGKVRRTSSRFCLGVEHGDYNGTELFGVGTDRFIWMAYKPNGTDRVRVYSASFPDDGVIDFNIGIIPSPGKTKSWARFPCGADYILRREGFLPK